MPKNDEQKIEQANDLITGRVVELEDLMARSRKELNFLKSLAKLLGVKSPSEKKEEEKESKRICPHCKKKNPIGAARCIHCNKSLR